MCFDLGEEVVSVLCGHTACVQINRLHTHTQSFLAILFYQSNRRLWGRGLRLLIGESFVVRANSSQTMNMQACINTREESRRLPQPDARGDVPGVIIITSDP